MPKRPGRTINNILDDFHWSIYHSPGQELTTKSSHFMYTFRQTHPEQMQTMFKSLPLILAREFLTKRGNHFFKAGSTYWIWPRDSNELVRWVAELMIRQNRYISERSPKEHFDKFRELRRITRGNRRTTQQTATDNTKAPLGLALNNSFTLSGEDIEIPGSPELPQKYLNCKAKTVSADRDDWSVTTRDSGCERNMQGSANLDTDSIPLIQLRDRQVTHPSTPDFQAHPDKDSTVPSAPPSQIGFEIRCQVEHIQPRTHHQLDIGSERTREMKSSSIFNIDHGTRQYELSNGHCAKVLGSTIARLEILRATSRLDSGDLSEYVKKVETLLSSVAGDMEQHAQ